MSNECHSSRERARAGAPAERARSSSRSEGPARRPSAGEARVARAPSFASRFPTLALASLSLGAAACSGIDAGVDYPSDLPADVDRHLLTPENGAGPSVTLGRFKINPETCKGIDTHPIDQRLAPDELSRFLQAQGAGSIAPKQARSNLYWFDFPSEDKTFVRLRLAVLETPQLATQDLHDSLLQHGPGWWGVHRSNLAVLAPKAGLEEALSFAIKYKLVCWGVFTYAGNDDAYVVPGPYAEL
jgi:hypothetical protein